VGAYSDLSVGALLFSAGGGFLLGAIAGYAIKKVFKVAAVVVGLFVAGLAYLSYKGWIDIKWMEMENATRATLASVEGQVVHALNSTTLQFATHSSMFATSGSPIASRRRKISLILGLRFTFMRTKIRILLVDDDPDILSNCDC
jgi:uncharacterized membrane protein (Fun14 family)